MTHLNQPQEKSVSALLLALQENRTNRETANPLEDKLVELIQGIRGDLGVIMRGIRNRALLQNPQREKRMFFDLDHVRYLHEFVLLCAQIKFSHPALDRIRRSE